MKVYPLESSTANRRKLYHEARKYETFRISFSRSSFLYNLIINLIVKGNVQFIFLCDPQKSLVNAFKRYTNADMKIYQYLRLNIKMICRSFRIIALFSF